MPSFHNAHLSVINPILLRILENLTVCPAYVLDQFLNVLAWNRAASLVFGDFSESRTIWWQDYEAEGKAVGDLEFDHPRLGSLKLDHLTLVVPGTPHFILRVYTPLTGTDSKIRYLLETLAN